MRQFIVVAHDGPTTSEFSLTDLPGAGRLDLLARAVTSSLLLSHGIRENVRVHLVLDDEFTIRFEGSDLRRLNPDERSTAALVQTALEERQEAVGHMDVETSPGVYLSRLGFETTLDNAASDGTVCQLQENGTPVSAVQPPENPIFVLSDHQNFAPDERETLSEIREHTLTLGPERLHADQAITVAHNWLDTGGFETY